MVTAVRKTEPGMLTRASNAWNNRPDWLHFTNDQKMVAVTIIALAFAFAIPEKSPLHILKERKQERKKASKK